MDAGGELVAAIATILYFVCVAAVAVLVRSYRDDG